MRNSRNKDEPKTIRCAIYTRKSTEEGLEQEFNSLDAQRESAEAYICSMKHEGWICLPTRYDDGGFTGGNMERPALRRLLDDIADGRIDCVIVYKVDRLSRSLMDFSRIMETFDKHRVSFVGVTQQFNTTSSMGRLTLNILLSFAQFEREIISERTRDKMAAARRKGKYTGGAPILGYDLARPTSKLTVNEREAEQVRAIFRLYLEHESLLATMNDLNDRDWRTKEWITHAGKTKGGVAFSKNNLHGLLTNVAYIGKTCYQDQLYEGEHEAIVDAEVFQLMQKLLRLNNVTGGKEVRNQYGAILKGLIRCSCCDCAMTPSHSTKGAKRYRYYVCTAAQKTGWKNCPSPSIPAPEVEKFVVDQIRTLVRDPELIVTVLDELREQSRTTIEALEREQQSLEQDLRHYHGDVRSLAGSADRNVDRLADLQERIRYREQRLLEVRDSIARLEGDQITEAVVSKALVLCQA
ncbi:MAG: recombinase family protein [Planctomycetaceae bacterium]